MRPLLLLLLLLCSAVFVITAGAKTGDPSVATEASQKAVPPPDAAQPPDVNAKLAAARSELDRFVTETGSKVPSGTSPDEVIERRSMLELIVRNLERQLHARDELAIVQRDRAALFARVKAWPGFGPGPHSLSLVDGLRESVQTAAERAKAAEAKLA